MPEQTCLGLKPMNESRFEIQTPRGMVNAILKTQEGCDLEGIFEGELSATLEGEHSFKFEQKGMFVMDASEGRRPILLEGVFETYSMDSQLLSSGKGVYKCDIKSASLNLDSDALGLDTPTPCELRFYENGHCISTQIGLFKNGDMQSGLLLQTPNRDSSKGRMAYRGTFTTGEEQIKNGVRKVKLHFEDQVGEQYVWREDGCIEIKLGFCNGKPLSGLYFCARLKEKQLDSLTLSSHYYPANALWTCTRHTVNEYSISSMSTNELDSEYVLAMFLEIEQSLVELEYSEAVQGPDAIARTPIHIRVTAAKTQLKRPVALFDGTVWELIEGALDQQGCLQGHAIIQQSQTNDCMVTVDGNFLDHHFSSGTIENVCFNISRQIFSGTWSQNKVLGTLTTILFSNQVKTEHTGAFICGANFNIQHMKGKQPGVVRKTYSLQQNIDANTQQIWELSKQFEGVVVDGTIYESGVLTEKTYLPDQVKTKKIMSNFLTSSFQIGDQVENETVQSDRIVKSIFIYTEPCDKKSSRYSGRKNIVTTYTDDQPTFNVVQVGLFGVVDSLEVLIQGTYQFGREGEEGSHVVVIEEGLFTPEGMLDNHHHSKTTCERKIVYNENLSTHMEGTFAKGKFLVGKCTKKMIMDDGVVSSIISWGKWREGSKAVRSDADYELHDPNGVSYQINETKQQGIRYSAYQDGQCSEASSRYIFVYQNNRLILLSEWSGEGEIATEHWTLTRNSAGEFDYQKATASSKKKDKVRLQLDKEQAEERFYQIEAELVELKFVERQQPTETLEDLVRQEEIERKAQKSKKTNDKKQVDAEKRRKELEHQPKTPEAANKKKLEKKEMAKKNKERQQSLEDVLLSAEKGDDDNMDSPSSNPASIPLRGNMEPSPDIGMVLDLQHDISQCLSFISHPGWPITSVELPEQCIRQPGYDAAKIDVDEMLNDALGSRSSTSQLHAGIPLSNANIPASSLVVGAELTTKAMQENGVPVSPNPYSFYFYDSGLQGPIRRPATESAPTPTAIRIAPRAL